MAKTTDVSGPSSGAMPAATAGKAGAFTVTRTTSCGAARRRVVAGARRWHGSGRPWRRTWMPFACMAARLGPRATTDTSAPPLASGRRDGRRSRRRHRRRSSRRGDPRPRGTGPARRSRCRPRPAGRPELCSLSCRPGCEEPIRSWKAGTSLAISAKSSPPRLGTPSSTTSPNWARTARRRGRAPRRH